MTNTLTKVEYDERTGEYDSITKVISGGRVYDVPTEWISPDCEYITTSDDRDANRDAQYEPEQDWVNYDAVEADVTGTAPTGNDFPVLTSSRLYRHESGDVMQECMRPGCRWSITWAGFAGDAHDFTIAGMVHWYQHTRRGPQRTNAKVWA